MSEIYRHHSKDDAEAEMTLSGGEFHIIHGAATGKGSAVNLSPSRTKFLVRRLSQANQTGSVTYSLDAW